MNGKTKATLVAGLTLAAVASAVYVAPTLAYMNNTLDPARVTDRDRLRVQTCSCDCWQAQNQTRAHLRLH